MTLEDDKEILMYISFYLSQTPSPGTNLSLPPSLLPSPDWRDLYHLVRDNLGGGVIQQKLGYMRRSSSLRGQSDLGGTEFSI